MEDEWSVRQCLAEYLTDVGFKVFTAEDGDQALTMLEDLYELDLLITDIDIPGQLDGNGVATRRHQGLFAIYASGRPDQLMNKIEQRDTFVDKPFGPVQMTAVALRILVANNKA